jgi:hypothetical protein
VETLGLVLGGAVGLGGGIAGGLAWGERLKEQPSWRYWSANGIVMMAGMFLVFAGTAFGVGFVWTAGVGLMGGGVTGLKYGYGKSVGLWRTADRLTGVDDLPKS